METALLKEKKRGCGYRKPSSNGVGIYLMGGKDGVECMRMPFPLHECACCGGGIHFSRNWTTITPTVILAPDSEPLPTCTGGCPVCQPPAGQHGLLWIGKNHYPTPKHFLMEAGKQGVSRKLPSVPKDLVIGETFVYLAHLESIPGKVVEGEIIEPQQGIFASFKPTHIDFVVDDLNDIPDTAKNLYERHADYARVVQIEKVEDEQLAIL